MLGTPNIGNRFCEHNHEANVGPRDETVAARPLEDQRRDLEGSTEVTLEQWQRRSVWEKVIGASTWILERQQ